MPTGDLSGVIVNNAEYILTPKGSLHREVQPLTEGEWRTIREYNDGGGYAMDEKGKPVHGLRRGEVQAVLDSKYKRVPQIIPSSARMFSQYAVNTKTLAQLPHELNINLGYMKDCEGGRAGTLELLAESTTLKFAKSIGAYAPIHSGN